jgi:sugar/nucleoside kinase (ribokinase family)
MEKSGNGICVAGNMIVDILYPITDWPSQGELTTITEGISRTTGGAVCNVIMDLAKLDPGMKLTALGLIGEDSEGDFVLEKLGAYRNIDLSRVKRRGMTSFTAVMCNNVTKQRTFFTYGGANDLFDEESVDWDGLDCGILHIGYILLLKALDREDGIYGTKMARFLHSAQEHGIKTSLDVVTEKGNRFSRLVPPSLKYADYCVINEMEAQQTTGIILRDPEDRLMEENIPAALVRMLDMGVSEWAVIHSPEGGYGMTRSKDFVSLKSLSLPKGFIKGTVGAGDAFCAGVLLSAERGRTLREAIELGIASSACSLSEAGSTEGMRSAEEAMKLYRKMRD